MATSRYSNLITNNQTMLPVPGITISSRTTDKFVQYNSRLDVVASSIYGQGNEVYTWLILLANPQYFLEFDISRGTVIRIPFPLNDALAEYNQSVNNLKNK